jgi:hypothetical protein
MRRTVGLALAALFSGTFAFFSMALFSPVAPAVPAFARKTGLACSACHEVWPRLNDFGQLFRDRGYRLERDRDAPVQQDPSYWPLAMRTTAGYQWLRQSLVPTDAGPVTTNTGSFGFTGLDVFAVGTLGERISFLITLTPGLVSAGFGTGPADGGLESAFVGFHDVGGTPFLNFRVGKHAPDLPIDEHRQITLTQGYNVYHFHPAGSIVTWEPGENQAGFEVYGHSDLDRFRYSFSLVNENGAPLSNNIISTPVAWGHITGAQYLNNPILAAVKGGVFGSVGWHPTSALTLTAPGGGTSAPVPFTDSGLKQHYRYGAEAHLQFFSVVNPLTISAILWGGSEDKGLIVNGAQDARFLGGFVEGVWTMSPRVSLIGRYELIRTTQQGDPTAPKSLGDLTSWTAAVRHTFELTSRTECALQLELSRVGTDAGDGTTPDVYTGMLAFDFTL